MLRAKLTPETVGPVARGHPWVYRDGTDLQAEPGTPVQLVDGKGRAVAFGLADEGDIAVRVLGRYPEPIPKMLEDRIGSALRLRRRLLPERTNAYRWLNGAGDTLPGLVIDRYADLAVVRLYGKCWVPHLDAITSALTNSEDPPKHIARRLGVRRVDQGDGLVDLLDSEIPQKIVVEECGLRFLVRPHVGQKTGLFLDQREHRAQIGRIASDLTVVNLFAYTGGFSVHAAAGGAKRVITVDISEPAIEDAKENFRLNDLRPEAHAFFAEDAFEWTPEHPPDLLICDPPSLSHGKKSDGIARTSYRDLARHCGGLLKSEGILATASCTSRLNQTQWEDVVVEGLRKSGRWSWLWRAAEPPDHPVSAHHPEGRYLKFGILKKR